MKTTIIAILAVFTLFGCSGDNMSIPEDQVTYNFTVFTKKEYRTLITKKVEFEEYSSSTWENISRQELDRLRASNPEGVTITTGTYGSFTNIYEIIITVTHNIKAR